MAVRVYFTLGWMCALKREQARREWESELRYSQTTVYSGIHERSELIPL